ncbi:MAG: hypothetical protein ACRDNI_09610 [Gaiellaceae bacterium]
MLRVLRRHELEYIVIGGIGARIWGSPRNTDDLDICPSLTRTNKKRLAAALTELDAAFRPPGLEEGYAPPGGWDERSFEAIVSLALTTELGWLDVWFVPDGTEGYDDLIRTASQVQLEDGLIVGVADLEDIIRSKTAAGRNKDLAALDHLRELERLRGELGDGRT